MTLKRRLAKLEAAAAAKVPPEPEFSEQDIAIVTPLLERADANPVRYAWRVELLELIETERRGVASRRRYPLLAGEHRLPYDRGESEWRRTSRESRRLR